MGFPKDKRVMLGKNATMKCIVVIGTLADFRWLKWNQIQENNTQSLDFESNAASRYRVISQKYYTTVKEGKYYCVELSVVNVSRQDLGLYTCYVSNHLGHDYRSAILSELPPVPQATPIPSK